MTSTAAAAAASPPAAGGGGAPLAALPTLGLADLPTELLDVIVASGFAAADARLRADPTRGPPRVRGWGWVPPGDAPPAGFAVDAALWAAAGAPLVRVNAAFAAAAYRQVGTLLVEAPGAERRDAGRPPARGRSEAAVAAAAASSLCGFVRRCPAVTGVQVDWTDDADGGWTAAALEAPLLAAAAAGGTVKRLVRVGGDLTDALVDAVRPLGLTSLALQPVVVGDGGADGGAAGDMPPQALFAPISGLLSSLLPPGSLPPDFGGWVPAPPPARRDGGDGAAARHAPLWRLLATVAPTLTRLRLLAIPGMSGDVSADVWLGGPPTLPALEVLVHPLLDVDVAAVAGVAGACPALRRLDVACWRWPENYEPADLDRGLNWPPMDGRRLAAAARLAGLESLAAGPFDALPPAGLAAALGGGTLNALYLVGGPDGGDISGAGVAFGGATAPLPATIHWETPLTVAAATALMALPPATRAPLSRLKTTIDDGRVWGALAGLPLRWLYASVAAGAVARLGDARLPALDTLTLRLVGADADAAGVPWARLAAAAPALTSLTVAAPDGMAPAVVDAALAALPRLTAFAYVGAVGVDRRHVAAVDAAVRRNAAYARGVATTRRTVRLLHNGVEVDPWCVPPVGEPSAYEEAAA